MTKARNYDIRIASQNARGLKTDDKIHELSTSMTQRGFFAVCKQETWRNGVESIDHEGNRFIFNGLEKHLHRSCRGEQGVAIVLNSDAMAAWKAAMTPFIDSDHRAVLSNYAHLNIVKRLTRRQRVARLDQKLLLKPQIKNLFCQRVDNLYRESEETKSYSKLEQAMELAAFTTLPKSSRSQPGWFSSNQTHLNRPIEERNSAVALKIRKPTRNSVRRLRKARKDLKTEISRSKNNWILNICRDINEPANGSKIYWDKVKLLRKGLNKPKVS